MADGQRRARILLADDDADYLEVMGELLELHGFDIQTAQSAAEVEAALASRDPDIVLVDRLLGADDGEALARRIAASRAGRVRVALLSGLSRGEQEGADLAACGIAVFSKPVDFERLARFCRNLPG